jgi:hypothetical protein
MGSIVQCVARQAFMEESRKRLFKTGRTPGIPRQIGQVFSFGGLPNSVEQEQNIFVLVLIWT